MAYVKVADRAKEENNDEVKVNTTETVNTTDPRDAEIASLKEQVNLLMQYVLNNQNNAQQTVNVQNKRDEEITIIHLIQCYDGLRTHIKLTNREIDMTVIGETRILSRSEAEELTGKYRSFFERGVIAFSSDNAEFAKRFDLSSCVSDGRINRDFAKYIGEIDVRELERLYNSLGEAQKQFVIETFKRKIREGDHNYNDIGKIQLLERLTLEKGETNGAMEGVLMDINTQKIK